MQNLIKAALEALGSHHDSADLLVKHKNMCEENKATLEASLKGSEDKFFDLQLRVQEFELTRDTIDNLVTKFDEN